MAFPFRTTPLPATTRAIATGGTAGAAFTPADWASSASLGGSGLREYGVPSAAFGSHAGAPGSERGGAGARETRQGRDLAHQAKTLTRELEASREEADRHREEARRLRGNLDAKERELRLAKRALALAHEERAAAEAAVGTDKAYARKLEARLAASGGGAALREKHRQVRKQNALLHDEKAAQEAQLSAAENAVVEANREIATLRSALRIKSQELAAAPPGRTPAGATEAAAAAVGAAHGAASGEVTERLLYAVARAREESVILAVQLSERSQEVQNLKFELTKHVAELDEARQAREVTAREILALERKLAEVSGSSTRNESDATVLRTQLDGASKRAEASGREVLRLREAVEEARDALAAEKHRNLTHVSELQEATASSRRTLEKELAAARREMQEAKAAHAAEMGSLRGSCDELRLEALELKGKLSRDTEGLETVLADERRRRGELEQRFQATMASEASALSDAANAGAEADSLREANAVLYEQNARYKEEIAQLQGKLAASRADFSHASQRLDASTELHKQAEHSFQHRAEAAMSELGTTAEERDRLRVALHEALSRSDAQASETESLRTENARLEALVMSLQDSKALLEDAYASRAAPPRAADRAPEIGGSAPGPTARAAAPTARPPLPPAPAASATIAGPVLAEAWVPPPAAPAPQRSQPAPPHSAALPAAPDVAQAGSVADMLERLAAAQTAEELANVGLVSPPSEPDDL